MKFLFAFIALLVIASATQTEGSSYLDQIKNMGQEFIISEIQKQMLTSEVSNSTCGFSTATSCFSSLKGVFAGCAAAIASSGTSIMSDFACIKSLWDLRNTDFKPCFGCVCEFTQFIHFKLPICNTNEELLEQGMNIFEQLVKSQKQI